MILNPREVSVSETSVAFGLIVFVVYAFAVGLGSLTTVASAALCSLMIGVTTVYTARLRLSVRDAARWIDGWRGTLRMIYIPAPWIAVLAIFVERGANVRSPHWYFIAILAPILANPAAVLLASSMPLRWSVSAHLPWLLVAGVSILSLLGVFTLDLVALVTCFLAIIVGIMIFDRTDTMLRSSGPL